MTWLIRRLSLLAFDKLMFKIVLRFRPIRFVFFGLLGIIKANKYYTKRIDDLLLLINPHKSIIDLRICVMGLYEPEVMDYMKARIKPGMIVVDIGANNGVFSLLAARLTGGNGRVIAYEPCPDTYRILVENIHLNHIENIVPLQCAISNRNGKQWLNVNSDFALNSILNTDTDSTLEVESLTLDESLRQLGIDRCDFILMDIEGAECLAIQGMEDTLGSNRSIELVISTHLPAIARLGWTASSFSKWFSDRGFDVFILTRWGALKKPNAVRPEHRGPLVCTKHSAGQLNLKGH